MLQSYFGFQHVDGVYWTLPIEIMFCALIGAILLFKTQKRILLMCLAWITISCTVTIFRIYFDSIILKLAHLLLVTVFSQMFVAGIVIYQFYKNSQGTLPYVILGLCVVNQYINFGLVYTMFFAFVISFLYLIAVKKLSFTVPHSLEFIAKISYPLYLTHQFIGFGIIKHLESYGLTNEIFLVIPITVAITLGYLIYKFVEEPSVRYLRKLNPFKKVNQLPVGTLGAIQVTGKFQRVNKETAVAEQLKIDL